MACLEEIAYRQGYIDDAALEEAAARYGKSSYGRYIKTILDDKHQFPTID